MELVKSSYASILEEVKASNQIRISAIEREQAIKKEVYMEAIEAVTKSLNSITSFTDLNISEDAISSELSNQSGKIAKIQIVGSKETFKAVTIFMGAVGTGVLRLMLDRSNLLARKNEIDLSTRFRDQYQSEVERYISIMKNLNLSGNTDKNSWDNLNRSIEFECQERDKHTEHIDKLAQIQMKEHSDYVRKCMDSFFEISKLLPQIILSVRTELGIEIETKDYLEIFNNNLEIGKAVFDDFLLNIERSNS